MEQTIAEPETRDRIADAFLSHFLGGKNTVSHLLGVNLCQKQNRSGCGDLFVSHTCFCCRHLGVPSGTPLVQPEYQAAAQI